MMQTEIKALDGRSNFDFLMGSWNVHCRRLMKWLSDCTEWEEFKGTSEARKFIGGAGNIDEYTFYRNEGEQYGCAIRLYDTGTQQWRIYWASPFSGVLDVPMIGGFKNGRGEFYSQELFQGRAIFNRYLWIILSEDVCQWEQAFSPDGGSSWETNWIMKFSRTG